MYLDDHQFLFSKAEIHKRAKDGIIKMDGGRLISGCWPESFWPRLVSHKFTVSQGMLF